MKDVHTIRVRPSGPQRTSWTLELLDDEGKPVRGKRKYATAAEALETGLQEAPQAVFRDLHDPYQ
jgi:hypothetical protein